MTRTAFSFRVLGHATGKARPRVVRGHAFTPKRTLDAEFAVKLHALSARPPAWPLAAESYSVDVSIYERRGKGGGRRGPPPDLDNVAKMILDALIGVAFADDRQVDVIVVARSWTPGAPSTLVTVRRYLSTEHADARLATAWLDPTEAT